MDRWNRRVTPDGQDLWETDEIPVFEREPSGRLEKAQHGRDRKGRFRTGPQGFMDDEDVRLYSRGVEDFEHEDEENLRRYLAGDLVDFWVPTL